jgi:hypothetical protein
MDGHYNFKLINLIIVIHFINYQMENFIQLNKKMISLDKMANGFLIKSSMYLGRIN